METKEKVYKSIKRSTSTTLTNIQYNNPNLSNEEIYNSINTLIEEGKIELAGGINSIENFHDMAVKKV